jgi:ABC-type antimicrobial peptide transport system permease subunit
VEVVGIVEDGKYESLSEDPRAVMFRPSLQSYNSTMVVVARSDLPAREMAARLAEVIGEVDPHVPLLSQQSMTDAVAVAFLPARAATVALTAFGAIALLIALTGVYGLAAYAVSARTRDIGICVAVGAQRRHVMRFALGRTAVLLGIGSLIGFVSSTTANSAFAAVMFHASSREPLLVLSVLAVMVVVGVVAAWVPARRALALDPSYLLRSS